MRSLKILAAMTAALLITACANQKEPAEKAVAQVEASLGEIKAEAQSYAAEELKTVEESVEKLKSQLANKDYKGAVMGAPAVASTVTALKETIAKKKIEAEEMLVAAQQEWTELNASVPEMVTRLQARFDSKKLPKGLDKASFEEAKQKFEALKTSWGEATTDFTSGAVANAVRKAREIKAEAEQLVENTGA